MGMTNLVSIFYKYLSSYITVIIKQTRSTGIHVWTRSTAIHVFPKKLTSAKVISICKKNNKNIN